MSHDLRQLPRRCANVAKELEMRGAFRFHEELGAAVELLGKGLVDVKPLR
jgi:L-idonate 5-dehydrogenase